jgi:hypothetical protein
MVPAAVIFILGGLMYAGWCVSLVLAWGFHAGAVLMLLVSAALCYEGYALVRSRRSARLWGIVMSLVIAGSSAVIAAMIWTSDAFVHGGVVMVALCGVFVAFTVAAVSLLASRDRAADGER